MDKISIGIDESYQRTGITVLMNDYKEPILMKSVNFEGCKTNYDKREFLVSELFKIMDREDSLGINNPHDIGVIVERIRLKSQGFISFDYIKSMSALVSKIIDFFMDYDIPVYSVDTRSWKSTIVGTSTGEENKYGINPKKYPTIKYMRDNGLLKYIVEPYEGKGTIGVIKVKMDGKKVPCRVNDDLADSYCIAKYWFLDKRFRKIKEERF